MLKITVILAIATLPVMSLNGKKMMTRSQCGFYSQYGPVCGLDGITYLNLCDFVSHSTTLIHPLGLAHFGPCKKFQSEFHTSDTGATKAKKIEQEHTTVPAVRNPSNIAISSQHGIKFQNKNDETSYFYVLIGFPVGKEKEWNMILPNSTQTPQNRRTHYKKQPPSIKDKI